MQWPTGVVDAVDGNPDLRVGEAREEPTPENAGGNRVVIDIGDAHFGWVTPFHAGAGSPIWAVPAPPADRTRVFR